MSIRDYMQDHILLYLLHAVLMLLLLGFLYATGYPWANGMLILICWLLALAAWTVYTWADRRRYFREAAKILEQTDQRFLLGELLPPSPRLEDRIWRDMIRRSNQSVIERIRRIERERQDYREFVENWVHEIKAPVTAVSLICENMTDALTEPRAKQAVLRIALENDRIAGCVDLALYYARSDEVYKDYRISETDLEEVVAETVIKNRRDLILNGVSVETDVKETVYTDEKWISFILTQLLLNSAKYGKEGGVCVRIRTERTAHGVLLFVQDDGIGIPAEDLPRVFEKGFTGSNGRGRTTAAGAGEGTAAAGIRCGRATGMGLYLCKKLCGKLGIGITAESEAGCGTTVILEFPVSTYLTNL